MESCPKTLSRSKKKDKAAFYFPAEGRLLPIASTKEPEERDFVVDSGAGMHMLSKRDLNSGELESRDDGDDGCKPQKKRRCMSSN